MRINSKKSAFRRLFSMLEVRGKRFRKAVYALSEFTPETPPTIPKITHKTDFTISKTPPASPKISEITTSGTMNKIPQSAPVFRPPVRRSLPATRPQTKLPADIATTAAAPEAVDAVSVIVSAPAERAAKIKAAPYPAAIPAAKGANGERRFFLRIKSPRTEFLGTFYAGFVQNIFAKSVILPRSQALFRSDNPRNSAELPWQCSRELPRSERLDVM